MPSNLIRIAIVAPAAALRAGLRALLSEETDLQVMAEAVDIQDIDRSSDQIDVLIAQTDENLLEVLQTQPGWQLHPAVLFLNPAHMKDLTKMIEPGLLNWGVIGIEASPEELRAAVRALYAGLFVCAPQYISSILFEKKSEQVKHQDSIDALTPREIQVLQLLAEGLPNKQIAATLQISEHTVKYHISSIYSKLSASNRTEAVRSGIRGGWITF